MEVIIKYSQAQLNAAVNFIATHNEAFEGRYDYVRTRIIRLMYDIASHYPREMSSTMGFSLQATWEIEGIGMDENWCTFDILVDPALADNNHWAPGDVVEVKHEC